MNLLFLDIETTGLNPQNSVLLEIGAALYLDFSNNSPVSTYNRKIAYEGIQQIQLGALAVNKVKISDITITSTTRLGNYYPEPLLDFVDWLIHMKSAHGDFVITGHNVNFDLSYLEAKLNDNGVSDLRGLTGYRVLDIASVGFFLKLIGIVKTDKPTGENLAAEVGVPPPTHTAMSDVKASVATLAGLMALAKEIAQ